MIKLFVSDVDGTLLDSTVTLRPEVIRAVETLRGSGVHFAIASGRNYESIQSVMAALGGAMPVICLNGAQIYDDTGACIRQHPIPSGLIPVLWEVSRRLGCYTTFFCTDGTYSPFSPDRAQVILTDSLAAMRGMPRQQAEDLCSRILAGSRVQELPKTMVPENTAFLKVQYVFSRKSQLCQALELLSGQQALQLAVSPFDLEVTAAQADKATAVLTLCGHLGIAPEEIAVIGDSANDRQMLSVFAHSFAMGNADPETRLCARYVTASNDRCGVAEAIHAVLQKNLAP